MLLTPATKEIVSDAASGGAWTSRNPRQVSRTSVDGITPGSIENLIGVVEASSPAMIVIVGTDPSCGFNWIPEVGNIRKFTSPGLVRQSQKLDAAVDRKFSYIIDSTSIFGKVISEKFQQFHPGYLHTL